MPAITRALNVLARCGNRYRGEQLAPLGITPMQASYLLHIVATPGMSQEEAARALHVNPSNAARQVALLMENGFVQRSVSEEDRRRTELYPTDKAREAAARIRQVNAAWHEILTQGMLEKDRDMLQTLLNRVCERAEAWAAGEEGK